MQLRFAPQEQLMIVRITVNTASDTTKTPKVDNAYKGGVVAVAEVTGESYGGEEFEGEDFPGAAMGEPGDDGC